jgi:hypothetical protein
MDDPDAVDILRSLCSKCERLSEQRLVHGFVISEFNDPRYKNRYPSVVSIAVSQK